MTVRASAPEIGFEFLIKIWCANDGILSHVQQLHVGMIAQGPGRDFNPRVLIHPIPRLTNSSIMETGSSPETTIWEMPASGIYGHAGNAREA
jgi:hypothetical protein